MNRRLCDKWGSSESGSAISELMNKRGEVAEKEATLHYPTPHVILWTLSLAKNSILQNKLIFWTIQKSFCVNPVQINNKRDYYFSSLHKVQV